MSILFSPRHSSMSPSFIASNVDKSYEDDDKDHAHLLYAQKLNNNAAMCIEVGYYERAIQSLKKALQFSEKRSDESLTQACRCDGCFADGCIDFADDFASSELTHHSGMPVATRSTRGNDDEESSDDEDDWVPKTTAVNEKCAFMMKSISQPRIQRILPNERIDSGGGQGKNASWSIKDEYCDDEYCYKELQEYKSRDDEIYKRPIRVTREGHPMGSSLFLIITFNLALAHHLEVAEVATEYNDKSYNPKSTKKALLFYELTSAYESKLLADCNKSWCSISSVRFNTILNNNLNQVRHMLPDKCLPAFNLLLSNVSDAIDKETEQLSARTNRKSKSSSRKSNSSSDSRKSDSDRRGLSRTKSSSTAQSSKSSSFSRRSVLRSKSSSSSQNSKPSSRSSFKLQFALGDMALTNTNEDRLLSNDSDAINIETEQLSARTTIHPKSSSRKSNIIGDSRKSGSGRSSLSRSKSSSSSQSSKSSSFSRSSLSRSKSSSSSQNNKLTSISSSKLQFALGDMALTTKNEERLLSNDSDAINIETEQLSARTNRNPKSSSRKINIIGDSHKSGSGRSSLSRSKSSSTSQSSKPPSFSRSSLSRSKSSSSSQNSKPTSISNSKLQIALGDMVLPNQRKRKEVVA